MNRIDIENIDIKNGSRVPRLYDLPNDKYRKAQIANGDYPVLPAIRAIHADETPNR